MLSLKFVLNANFPLVEPSEIAIFEAWDSIYWVFKIKLRLVDRKYK